MDGNLQSVNRLLDQNDGNRLQNQKLVNRKNNVYFNTIIIFFLSRQLPNQVKLQTVKNRGGALRRKIVNLFIIMNVKRTYHCLSTEIS